MIGKIIVLIIIVLGIASVTGTNLSPYYEKLVSIRDQVQPHVDTLTESFLTKSSEFHPATVGLK